MYNYIKRPPHDVSKVLPHLAPTLRMKVGQLDVDHSWKRLVENQGTKDAKVTVIATIQILRPGTNTAEAVFHLPGGCLSQETITCAVLAYLKGHQCGFGDDPLDHLLEKALAP